VVEPDIAFSASSTIKVAVVTSYLINARKQPGCHNDRDYLARAGQGQDNTETDQITRHASTPPSVFR